MTNRFRISGTLARRLEESKVSPGAVLRRAIHEISGDPAIGLKLGNNERPEHYSPIAIAALYSRSLRDALDRIALYKRLTCPEEIRAVERGKECAVEFVWLLADKAEPVTLIDVCFAWAVAIGGRGTGRRINPLRVEFKRRAGNRRLYENHFRCPVTFGARHNRLVFRTEDMNQPCLTHNPELLELIAPQLDAELRQQQADDGLKPQVKTILTKLLAGHRPRLEDVARELGTSARTLQRRLLDEGMSFHSLVEEARRELAKHYLLQSSLELNETAYLLGYEDPNSFFRAFHKWEGASPGEWRSRRARNAP